MCIKYSTPEGFVWFGLSFSVQVGLKVKGSAIFFKWLYLNEEELSSCVAGLC